MSWEETTLGHLISETSGLIQTGPFGAQLKQAEYTEEGVPVIMPKDIKGGRIKQDTVARIPEAKADKLERHKVKPDTIVFPRRGEITKRAYITENQAGWICGTGCLRIEPPDGVVHPKFLYYFMGTLDSIDWLQKNAVGATMLNLSGEILGRFPIKYPDLPTQERIASILSAYDDLIENNRRRIALLEQAARLLYREWFVHFRFPGHETAKFIDGLPEGWITTALGEEAQILKGKNITKETVKSGSVPVVAGGLKPAYFHDTANVKGPVLTISASGANAGHVSIYFEDIWASDCSYLSATTNPELFFFHQLLLENVARIRAMQKGAAQPHVYPKDLQRMEVTLPEREIIHQFVQLLDPLYGQIHTLEKQVRQLTRARDLLLPRLMDRRIPV